MGKIADQILKLSTFTPFRRKRVLFSSALLYFVWKKGSRGPGPTDPRAHRGRTAAKRNVFFWFWSIFPVTKRPTIGFHLSEKNHRYHWYHSHAAMPETWSSTNPRGLFPPPICFLRSRNELQIWGPKWEKTNLTYMEMSQSKDPLKNWRPFQLSTISPYHLEWVFHFETHPDLDYLQDGIKKTSPKGKWSRNWFMRNKAWQITFPFFPGECSLPIYFKKNQQKPWKSKTIKIIYSSQFGMIKNPY